MDQNDINDLLSRNPSPEAETMHKATNPDPVYNRFNGVLKDLVTALLQEARSKHLIDCLHDDYLNDDFHVEVTLTVGEIAAAAKALGINDF